MSQTITIIARPLPGYESRPDLAIVLKSLLRTHKLECVSVSEGDLTDMGAAMPDRSGECAADELAGDVSAASAVAHSTGPSRRILKSG